MYVNFIFKLVMIYIHHFRNFFYEAIYIFIFENLYLLNKKKY